MELELIPSGHTEAAAYFNSRPEKLRAALQTIIKKTVFVLERETKQVAPVITGRLRASIGGGGFNGGSFPAGTGIRIAPFEASIGPTVKYAAEVHRRKPFMVWGIRAAEKPLLQIVRSEINRAMTE